MSGRRCVAQLRATLGPGEAALFLSPANRFYLTGMASSAGWCVVASDKGVFFTDFRYIEEARRVIPHDDFLVVEYKRNRNAQLLELLTGWGIKQVLLEADFVTVREATRFGEALERMTLDLSGTLDTRMRDMRSVKSEEEIEKTARAVEITEQAFAETLPLLRRGMREREVAAELEYHMKKAGADGFAFETIAVTGANSSKPHGQPGDTALAAGDLLTMDFGALYGGYCADMTRTVAISEIGEEQRKVYETVRQAQELALAAIRPGIRCDAVDAVARDFIDAAGYRGCFGHALGHGVGVEIHEEPRFAPGCEILLQPGVIISVEPGIYLPGRFGVRIEDLVVVTADGCRNFNRSGKTLTVVD